MLPRLKNIGAARLHLPDSDLAPELPHLGSVLTRPIRCARLADRLETPSARCSGRRVRTRSATVRRIGRRRRHLGLDSI